MSYSIGPFMGKPPALIKKVKEVVDLLTGQSKKEAQAAADFFIPQLESLPADRSTCVRAYGSAWVEGDTVKTVSALLEIGQLSAIIGTTIPTIVE